MWATKQWTQYAGRAAFFDPGANGVATFASVGGQGVQRGSGVTVMRRCDAVVTGVVHQNVQRPVGFDALDQAAKRFAVGEVGEIRGVTPATDLLGNTVERGSVSPDERHLRAGGRETAGQLATNTATTPVTRTRLFLISLVA